jgi:phage/plasmid-associated DNA primase
MNPINSVMDGNLIKKICSGGDKLQMRTNYINEIDVRIQGTLILFNNDMPKVELCIS